MAGNTMVKERVIQVAAFRPMVIAESSLTAAMAAPATMSIVMTSRLFLPLAEVQVTTALEATVLRLARVSTQGFPVISAAQAYRLARAF